MASVKDLITERGLIKSALTRFKTYFESCNPEDTIPELRERLDRVMPLFDKFDRIQGQIDIRVLGTENEDAQTAERDNFEKTNFRLVSSARARLEEFRSHHSTQFRTPASSPPPISEVHLSVKLPVIKLPVFDGTYDEWIRFRDTFESLIHTNDNLNNIQKFHYLNSSLKGDAARIIKSLGVSDVNYTLAWKTLKNRYEDPQILVRHHTKALFDLPVLTKTSSFALRQLIDDCNNHISSLTSLNQPTGSWDTMIIHLLSTKLDIVTKREWERKLIGITGNPTLRYMIDFLEGQWKYLEQSAIDRGNTRFWQGFPNARSNKNTVACIGTVKTSCQICNGNHAVFTCDKFKSLTPSERIHHCAKANLCFNCLQPGHRNKVCTRTPCRKCNKKHNTLLHVENELPSVSSKPTASTIENSVTLAQTNVQTNSNISRVVLGTAVVFVEDSLGQKHECRALLDPASQANFVTKNFCNKLKLPSIPTNRTISGIGQLTGGVTHQTNIKLHSQHNDFTASLSCFVLPKITEDLPNFTIDKSKISIPPNMNLADPNFYRTAEIDLLISGELFWEIICNVKDTPDSADPLFRCTKFGWIFAGRMTLQNKNKNKAQTKSKLICNLVATSDLMAQMQKFWEVEHCDETNTSENLNSQDECEIHFQNTVTRDSTGRYTVHIPFNESIEKLGNSRSLAETRFYSLERKLNKQPSLKTDYVAFMTEYETLGHMTEISTEPNFDNLNYYLPYHAVIKTDSTTTKLRVVFDGSAKTTTGISINDTQRVGPTVQDELFSIILRFRKHNYVISADVEKMYRQILITPSQRKFQRILWRTDNTLPLKIYELNTVTYGTASAPFLATRTLRKVGENCMLNYQRASQAIIKDFYVDDLLTGSTTLEEAQALKKDISDVLYAAGFRLRKWASNDPRITESSDELSTSVPISANKVTKTLGLFWNPHNDVLKISVKTSQYVKITKRTVLSEISQLFDPLGLVGPTTVLAKIFMQQLWQSRISWDECLPHELCTKWEQFRNELRAFDELSIPRHTLCNSPERVELHGFCDASELAYGACIFIRSRDTSGHYTVMLLCAKSRVAPLKKISLPRLELCGAVLLSNLIAKVRSSLNMKIDEEHYWTDSMITLAWIKAPSNRWKTFVANRTTEIQRLTGTNWRHISSEDNPADAISRGMTPSSLVNASIWWNGPTWLSKNSEYWPTRDIKLNQVPEVKESTLVFVTTTKTFHLFDKYSSLLRLLRVTAYCLRFVQNAKSHSTTQRNIIRKNLDLKNQIPSLSVTEIENAKNKLLRLSQQESFPQELNCLKKGKAISKHSVLQSLNLFIDEKDFIRLGGRLANSSVPYEQKYPIILSSKHPLTKLIILHEHNGLLHAGTQSVIASLRARYWPLQCRTAVKGVLRKCVRCFRVKPTTQKHLMGDLPTSIVTCQRPFSTCGVDYAGPFLLKERTRSRTTIKSYLCVFVCFTTKAVHLELAADLTTDAFLNCFRRFTARRGLCRRISSDNGTNFVGARNELRDLGFLLTSNDHRNKVTDFVTSRGIEWHMIPPHAPHFGGLWEGAVRSVKYHLKRIIGDTRLTYEELYTLLAQVESSLPHPDLQHIKINRLNRYQHIQYMLQQFWKRWHQEYFHQLQQRTKWRIRNPSNVRPGTLVLMKEDNTPPLKWKMGRIVELHPGLDDVVRVVSVRVPDGILKRPLTKIGILPITDDPEQNVEPRGDLPVEDIAN